MKSHQDGISRTTRRIGSIRLVYYEGFQDPKDAKQRERILKQYGGFYRELLKRIRRSRLFVLTHGGAG